MKLLIIGDQHIAGFGLAAGQRSFVDHFVRQIGRMGQAVVVDARPVSNLTEVCAVLTTQSLDTYDLIIWQSGAGCLESPVITPSTNRVALFWQRIKQMVWAKAGTVPRKHPVLTDLHNVLKLLRTHRHKVLITTPVPQQDKAVQRWREQGCRVLMREGYQQGFSVFDTSRQVRPTAEHFLANCPDYLNAVSHELIGRALFDFYQAAPTIVTIRSVRKN